ncbi:MAG: nucleotidyl transferase AbiEii/AbiGii toxin family protein [Elusimicrobia bacterium]|nr:nucleotidyl transferase AbiEii/AbiGii toxin family protein [Elusimicrobiota bacterium]
MPEFFHDRKDAKALFETLAAEKGYPAAVVEKDYWVMHCLWGLQQNGLQFEMKGGTSLSKGWDIIQRFSEDIDIRFNPPEGLNIKGEKPPHIAARFGFYDDLTAKISIPGIKAERNKTFDDEKAQNGGISLKYDSCFDLLPGLKPEVLLEAGFARTAPNEPRDFSSWVLDKALAAGLSVVDNRAPAVKCFNPEYTFVDKLQTICRRFRHHRDRNDAQRDRPRQFMRHYYDLFMLLGVERVQAFIGTEAYTVYKTEKLKGADAAEFAARTPFTLPTADSYALFDEEFESMNTLLLGPGPRFKEVVQRLREYSPRF